MRTWMKVFAVAGVLVLVAGVGVSAAYAQRETPVGVPGGGRGPRGPEGAPGSGLGVFQVDQEEMHALLAEELGLSVEEFESAIAEGETLYSLAVTYEVDFDRLREVMDEAHEQALAEAVAEGTITQDQADWLLERRGTRGQGLGDGLMHRRGGVGGRMGGPGDCLRTPSQ